MLTRLWNDQVTRAFDRWAPTYGEIAEKKIHERGYSYGLLAQLVWDQSGRPKVGLVAEIGTGPGVLGQLIPRPRGVSLVGIDISREMLKRVPPGVYSQTVCASAETIPLPSACAVGVFSTFMLHSIRCRSLAIQEMRRILVPGANGIIVDLFPAGGIPLLSPTLRFFHSLRHEVGAPANYVTVDHLLQELSRERLEVVHIEQLGMPKFYRHVAVTFRKS